jgi:hypothetical protein
MSFINAWYFLGLAGIAIPLILHLIKRERARRVEFPTLMFLRRVSRKTIRYQKLRNLLLLLLRVLTMALLALAFTRPYRRLPASQGSSPGGGTTHVILLDNSLSMGYAGRWERALQAARAIVSRATGDDRIGLIEFSDVASVRIPATSDYAAVGAEIDRGIELSDRSTRYAQAMKAAERAVSDATARRRIIHVISDFQKSGWMTDEEEFRMPAGIEIDPVDVGDAKYSNLVIGDVQVSDNADSKESGLKVRFSIVNYGTEDRTDARVSLKLDGRETASLRKNASRGEREAAEFELPGLTDGIHQVSLDVEDTNLGADNKFSFVLAGRGKTQVLCVEDAGSQGSRTPTFFLSRAINASGSSGYQLNVISLAKAESGGFAPGSLLVWNNASGGSSTLQRKVREFVDSGGGLLVSVPDNGKAVDFNRAFGSWLPVKLAPQGGGSSVRGVRAEGDYALLTDLRMDHPVFRPFSEPHSGNFSSARFLRHAKFEEGGEVLARFDNGDPALLSAAKGKGRVLVFASSADDSANNLPLKPVYAPFWLQMLHFLDNAGEENRQSTVGETIAPRKLLLEAAVRSGHPESGSGQAVVVLDPVKKRIPMGPGSDAVQVDRAGFYEIRSPGLSVPVAVNAARVESDLSHGNAEEMTAVWLRPAAAAAGPQDAESEAAAPEEQDRRQHFWRYLLLFMLAFFLAEFLLSSRGILKTEN